MSEHSAGRQPHVPDGAIAPERDGIPAQPWRHAIDRSCDLACLACTHHKRVQIRVHATDPIDTCASRILAAAGGNEEHDDPEHPPYHLKRVKAGLELGKRLEDGCRVVVGTDAPNLGRLVLLGPI